MIEGLTIGLDYVTGRCVAANISDRALPEWPPHFGRVFMAMAAACFETGEKESEVAALKWLECLGSPVVEATDAEQRTAVSAFVPVNDRLVSNKSLLQVVPGMARVKQERQFATVVPHSTIVKFVWKEAPDSSAHIEALKKICSEVIRVGHSSSLVCAWADVEIETVDDLAWQPTDSNSEIQARVVSCGEFERLKCVCNANAIEMYSDFAARIKESSGKVQKGIKAEFKSEFGFSFGRGNCLPVSMPPVLGNWQGYIRGTKLEKSMDTQNKYFDSQLLIFGRVAGRRLGIQDTLSLTQCFRAAVMKIAEQPLPSWLSGHDSKGGAIQGAHVAYLALPFAGYPNADGHLMGLALAMPKKVPPKERGLTLRALFADGNGGARNIDLFMGGLGIWTVRLEETNTPRRSLQGNTWIQASKSWASVTPVVLDKFPKSSRGMQRLAWEKEVAEIVAASCSHAGLPDPSRVDILTTAIPEGVSRAFSKSRGLRHAGSEGNTTAMVGDGFPFMANRSSKPKRPQVHVYLEFDNPVQGPVLLGAGRFLGYGLCKPFRVSRNRT